MDRYVLDLLVLGVFSALLWLRTRLTRSHALPLPPGPPGLPFAGLAFNMPKVMPWVVFADWAKKYGDVIYIENFRHPLVYLDTYTAAYDLLERKSGIYSDRPTFHMLIDVMDFGWMLPMIPYGDRLRKHRWMMHRFLNPKASRSYYDIQTRETHRMLASVLDEPAKYEAYLKRMTGAIVMMITYGHQVASENDHLIALADEGISYFAMAGHPGSYLVDFIPWLKYVPAWFPGGGFKRMGARAAKLSKEMLEVPYKMAKERIANGDVHATQSMVGQLLQTQRDKDGNVKDEDIIMGSSGIFYVGGGDTTAGTLFSFVLACVLFPEVQRKAQEEIDRVVGTDRLPTFQDRPSLPYIEGVLRESLRWNPIGPLGGAHRLMRDDEYKGMTIPKGTLLQANLWSILHQEDEYPDSHLFQPERWLPREGSPVPRNPNKVAFGFGRRLCPGRHLADNTLYISIVSILATMNITRGKDSDGNFVNPTMEMSRGALTYPKPFPCAITPRSTEAEYLIRNAVDRVK